MFFFLFLFLCVCAEKHPIVSTWISGYLGSSWYLRLMWMVGKKNNDEIVEKFYSQFIWKNDVIYLSKYSSLFRVSCMYVLPWRRPRWRTRAGKKITNYRIIRQHRILLILTLCILNFSGSIVILIWNVFEKMVGLQSGVWAILLTNNIGNNIIIQSTWKTPDEESHLWMELTPSRIGAHWVKIAFVARWEFIISRVPSSDTD